MNNNKSDTMDKYVHNILPFFETEFNRLPFRLLTTDKIIELSGLTKHMQSIQAKMGPLDPRMIRNLCGNCSHPALIESALGSTDDLRSWILVAVKKLMLNLHCLIQIKLLLNIKHFE